MWPYSLLLLTFFQLVASAPAPTPEITYNPTKEAPCAVVWDIHTDRSTEHYEVTGHCVFTGSADNHCFGGYRAPGFCPSENDRPVDCCISRKCGQGESGICVNSDRPLDVNIGQRYNLFADSACPSFWSAPAACRVPTQSPTAPPGEMNSGRPSPQFVQPETLEPSQPTPNDLSFNNNNLWTASASAPVVDAGNTDVRGALATQQQQGDVRFNLVNQQQQPAAFGVDASGGGRGAATDGFTLFDNNQPLVVSLGVNGDARDGIFFDDT